MSYFQGPPLSKEAKIIFVSIFAFLSVCSCCVFCRLAHRGRRPSKVPREQARSPARVGPKGPQAPRIELDRYVFGRESCTDDGRRYEGYSTEPYPSKTASAAGVAPPTYHSGLRGSKYTLEDGVAPPAYHDNQPNPGNISYNMPGPPAPAYLNN